MAENQQIAIIDNEQVSELVNSIIKERIPKGKEDEYQDSLDRLESKLQNVQGGQYRTAEDFVLECLYLFEGEEEEGPEEIYKGLSRREVKILMNNMLRQFKEELCDAFYQHPDKNYADATKAMYNQNVQLLVNSVIGATAGIPLMFASIMLTCFLTYMSRSGLKNICQ